MLLGGLNPEQAVAAECLRGPVRILAGAGTGKTRTITHRIAHQIAAGAFAAEQVLAVTFTDRAAAELRSRLAALGAGGEPAGGPAAGVRAATFHAAAWAQLRYFWPRLSERALPEVLTSKVPLLADAARRHRADVRDLAVEIEWAKARDLDPDAYAREHRSGPLPGRVMASVYREYEERKDAAGALDYEDMLLRMTVAMTTHAEVAAEVRARYRTFTVDEFQDVNPAQWGLLRAWVGDRDDVCVVGDDHQAIYGFTGASPRYLLDFASAFPGTRTFPLTANYRSTEPVLLAANAALGKGLRRDRRLRGLQGDGPAPTLRSFTDEAAECAGLITAIEALRAEGVPAGEIAICYRINRQSEPLERALAEAGIPFAVRGEGGFFQRREVRQALRVLRDAAARGPAPEIPGPTGPGGEDHAAPRVERPARELTRILRERLGWHPRKAPAGTAAQERWENLALLQDLVLAETSQGAGLADAVATLEARAGAGAGDGREVDAVSLLTLHRAKGLEFDAVFLVALEEGLLPISYAREPDEIEEERRLLHVGITRARRHLWLSWALERRGPSGKPSRRRPSRFLGELERSA